MDKNLFFDNFLKAKSEINKQEILETLIKSIESNKDDGNPRGHGNLIIVMEELSELTKEISKWLRGKGDRISMIEELADVNLGIYYIQEICKITDDEVHKAMNVKVDRLDKVLKEKGIFK